MVESGRTSGSHIILTSHPGGRERKPLPICWGAETAELRGPIIGTVTEPGHRNVIGTHAGSYSVYRALAVAAGSLSPVHVPDLTDTAPAEAIGPFPQWSDPARIVSLDPWGHLTSESFAERIAAGIDIRPTIAVTKARINMPELKAVLLENPARGNQQFSTAARAQNPPPHPPTPISMTLYYTYRICYVFTIYLLFIYCIDYV